MSIDHRPRPATPPAQNPFTGKRAATANRLCDATAEVLREVGYHDLTLHTVATRARVARATAYAYFSSKDRLVAETYWRLLSARTPNPGEAGAPADRVVVIMRDLVSILTDTPGLPYAVAAALSGDDPDIDRLRAAISRHVHSLLATAAGPGVDRGDIWLLELIYTGAMVYAGAGGLDYADVAAELETAAYRLLG